MSGPLIVQGDMTLLLEVGHPDFETARDEINAFSEIVKSPEYMHTYRMTPLSLWNAASAGISADGALGALEAHAKHAVPENVKTRVRQIIERYGSVEIDKDDEGLFLTAKDEFTMALINADEKASSYFLSPPEGLKVRIDGHYRGHLKQALMDLQLPAQDHAGFGEAAPLTIGLRESCASSGSPFSLRGYQQEAVDLFYASGKAHGGHGVIVLPCGAGKTIVGMGAMEKVSAETLVLTTSITAVRQWIAELLDKTSLTEDLIGEYSGEIKQIRPVTISTYQILSHRNAQGDNAHFSLFDERNWGLIIYDEVHMLPAPVFRMTAELQSKRRLGLTATLVREDDRQSDVFALIGPKRCEVPWKSLEEKGFIAKAKCSEIRIPLPVDMKMAYATSDKKDKFRIASENPDKMHVIKLLLEKHKDGNILIIGQYISQLKAIAAELEAPIITGSLANKKRELLYSSFKRGDTPVLVVSKVANFAIDLPDANVAIEVSGTFGSRQEEAQRLGRILRPKEGDNEAHFYALVTKDSREEDFAGNRQLFLIEQGYPYEILEVADISV
ncbi:MAG: DEAD/DEAH box helicase [Eubacteriaceae bacterium]|nr:DEAD/DEAH box helicase [Eubacteriaceae bacterium]